MKQPTELKNKTDEIRKKNRNTGTLSAKPKADPDVSEEIKNKPLPNTEEVNIPVAHR